MRLVESRATLTLTYIALGVLAFIALFPIALLVLNSLKSAQEIVQNPLSPAAGDPLGQFRPRLGGCAVRADASQLAAADRHDHRPRLHAPVRWRPMCWRARR